MSITFEQFGESGQNEGEPTPFMVAVKENQLEDVKRLYDEFENESALPCAREMGHGDIVKFLQAQSLEEKRRDEFRNLSYSEFQLIRDSFITKEKDDDTEKEYEILQIKGFALLMEYFAIKDKNSFYNCYVADNEQALMHAFETLMKARSGVRFSVIYRLRLSSHYVPILCEKIEGYYHITVQDSIEKNEKISELVSKGFKGKLKCVILNQNDEARQKTKFDCGFFTIKDGRKTLKLKLSEFFSLNLEKDGHILKVITQKNGLRVRLYRNPPEFMRLAQSMRILEIYAKNYPGEASRILRENKKGEPQTLMQYALQKRNKYGIETPFQVPSDDPAKPKIQNRTISYFGNKYLGIIDKMIRDCTQDKLREIIDTYDATKLRVCSDGAVRTETQERIFIKQEKENVQIADRKETKENVPLVIAESRQAGGGVLLTSSRKRKRLGSDVLSDSFERTPFGAPVLNLESLVTAPATALLSTFTIASDHSDSRERKEHKEAESREEEFHAASSSPRRSL